jgi:protease-4
MTQDDGHHLYERRRLRRRIGFWRLIALLAVVGAAATYAWNAVPSGAHVARFAVVGPIFEDPRRDAFLRELAEDEDTRALVLRVDSPGGSVAGSESLFEAVRTVAERKPVVAVMGEVAASGGYIAALAADHIIARGGTITGSIGVIAQFPNVEELLDTIGVGFARVASGELKAEPSPLSAPSDRVLEVQEEVVDDAYRWFIDLVASRRGLDTARAETLGDGRIYTGRQAASEGLIDGIGGEPEARDWLAETRDIPRALEMRDVAPPEPFEIPGLLGTARLEALVERLLSGPRLMAILR